MVREVSGEEKGGGMFSCCVQACKRVEEFPSVEKLSRRASNMTASFLKEPSRTSNRLKRPPTTDTHKFNEHFLISNILRCEFVAAAILYFHTRVHTGHVQRLQLLQHGAGDKRRYGGGHFLRLHARWWGGFYCLGGLLCITVLAGYINRQQP